MKKNLARTKLCTLVLCGLISGCDSVFASFLVYPDAGGDASGTGEGVCGDPSLQLCLRFEEDLRDESPKHFAPLDPPPDIEVTKDSERGLVGLFGQQPSPTPFRLKHDASWELTQYSFDAWVFPAKETRARYGLIDRSRRFSVFLYDQGSSSLWMACGIHDQLASGPTVPIGAWSHIACVASASKVDFYLNGQFTNSVPIRNITPVTQTIETFVGSNEPDGSDAFVGMLDELRLFKRLRTAEEIAADAARDPKK